MRIETFTGIVFLLRFTWLQKTIGNLGKSVQRTSVLHFCCLPCSLHNFPYGVVEEVTGYHLTKIICIIAQKMKFSIKTFFSKSDQTRSFLRIWSHLLKKSLSFAIFCTVYIWKIALKLFLSAKLFFTCYKLRACFVLVPFRLMQDCTSNKTNL